MALPIRSITTVRHSLKCFRRMALKGSRALPVGAVSPGGTIAFDFFGGLGGLGSSSGSALSCGSVGAGSCLIAKPAPTEPIHEFACSSVRLTRVWSIPRPASRGSCPAATCWTIATALEICVPFNVKDGLVLMSCSV